MFSQILEVKIKKRAGWGVVSHENRGDTRRVEEGDK